MSVSDPIYLFILTLALITSSFATIYSWRRKSIRGARTFALNSAIGVLQTLCVFLLVFSPSRELALFSLRLRFILQMLAITSFSLFVMDFAGYTRWVALRRFWIFLVVPLFAILVMLSNHFEDWLVIGYSVQRQDFLLYEQYQTGPLFTISLGYAFLLYLMMLIILGIQSLQVNPPFRWQVLTLFVIVLFTTFITIPSLSSARAVNQFIISPIALQTIFRSVLITWALFSFRFLNIMPIASNAIIEGLHSPVVVLDEQKRVVTMNHAALNLTTIGLPAAVGRTVQHVLPDLSTLFSRYDGNQEINEEVNLGLPGNLRYFECQLYPLENSGNRRVGHLLKLYDITARKEAEAEREQLIADLNAYAHTVAHDLKTPTSILIGYADFILDPDGNLTDAERRQYLETIRRTSVRMHSIIEELLLLSSIRSQFTVPIEPLDMQKMVKNVILRLEPILEERSAKVTIQGLLPIANGHAGWLEQVWINYLSNAAKYGGSPPEIMIGAEAQGTQVRFWVRDNGHGLDPEQQSRLFQEFSRVTETAMEGNGLGLSIVRRIIEKLGGQVGVESAIGRGSTFYFVLPGANGH